VKSCEPLALLANRYAPVCTESINAKVILAPMEFLDLINCQRDGAPIWFQTLVYKRVDALTQTLNP
jgi:hypothetical protein